jgi:Holliday junction DNA helicase RuvA
MISKLSGVIDSVTADSTVIDVGGVGYLVFCSARTISILDNLGSFAKTSLLIETHVREDRIQLFGFIDATEREWFRLLTSVQGVSTRIALAVLSALDPDQLMDAVAAQDKAILTCANGVGPKLAARIAAELKDRVTTGGAVSGSLGRIPARNTPITSSSKDAASALVNLGYSWSAAFTAVSAAVSKLGANASLDQLIPAALQELALR